MYVMSFPRANTGRWGKGRGENIAIILTLISTSHVEQLCSSLSQTNYSMIVALLKSGEMPVSETQSTLTFEINSPGSSTPNG